MPIVPRGAEVEITFAAGHGEGWAEVPGELRQAVLMLAGFYYEHRHGDALTAMPPAVAGLIRPWRPVRI